MSAYSDEKARQYTTKYGHRLSESHLEVLRKLSSFEEAKKLSIKLSEKRAALRTQIETEKAKRFFCFASGDLRLINRLDAELEYWELFTVLVVFKGNDFKRDFDV